MLPIGHVVNYVTLTVSVVGFHVFCCRSHNCERSAGTAGVTAVLCETAGFAQTVETLTHNQTLLLTNSRILINLSLNSLLENQ